MRAITLALRTASALLVVLAAGCASIPPDAGSDPRDPYERFNRHVFEFNEQLDATVLRPVAEGYVKVVPTPVRDCVANVFANIADVPNALNQLLQGKPRAAASDMCRVALNSTVGVLGCFDVASRMGLERHNEDFGQTLGRWGLGTGAYLVLPFFGPRDVRDTFGLGVDFYADPLSYVEPTRHRNVAGAVRVVDTRAGLLDAGKLLEGAALDKYRFVRDAYLQRRRSLVYDGEPPMELEDPETPEGDQPINPDSR
jgi:phospholipid-binding lipoprotein MlaA